MKRIRGLRRHARRVSQWQQHALPALNLDLLHQQHYDYQKLGVNPWQNIYRVSRSDYEHPEPPVGLQRELVAELLNNFKRWQKTLATLDHPSYLAIGVFEVECHRNQLIAAIQERIEHYQRLFGEAIPTPSLLPDHFRTLPELNPLEWRAYYYEEPLCFYDADEPDDVAFRKRYLHHRTFRTQITPGGEVEYWVRRGRVWVGQRPT